MHVPLTKARAARQPMLREILPIRGREPHPAAGAILEFGPFRVLLRRRQLLADGVPVELGTRAFDLLMVLVEADGLLVTKEELLSRVWPGIVVSEHNLKVQIAALRRALGADRDFIRTEFGRGYRFIAALSRNAPPSVCRRAMWSDRKLFPQTCRRSLRGWLASESR
jgi:DNA-binding winged helix-turn-helix (wHTH) protein